MSLLRTYLSEHTRRKRIYRVVTVLAAMAVFITTYALILPAITMDEEAFCGIENHEHTLQCYSDPTADKEDPQVWKQMIEAVEYTGDYQQDVAAIAKSQLGYTESSANYQVREDGVTKDGYTRYGDWLKDAYGDWDAAFCGFCMNYAGVDPEAISYSTSSADWAKKMQAEELFREKDSYEPQIGDVVFLDEDGDGAADGCGIITETKKAPTALTQSAEAGETPAVEAIDIVEGDAEGTVASASFGVSDAKILGYGTVPDKGVVFSKVQLSKGVVAKPNASVTESVSVSFTQGTPKTVSGEDTSAMISGTITFVKPKDSYSANSIRVTVPCDFIKDKNGDSAGSFGNISITGKPENSFSYSSDGDLVITNNRAFANKDGDISITISFTYTYNPSVMNTGVNSGRLTATTNAGKTGSANYNITVTRKDSASLEWLSSSGNVTDGGKTLEAAALDSSSSAAIQGKINLFQNASTCNANDLVMTLPLHVIRGRNGQWADTFSISGLPATFTYTTDEENNLVTIKNQNLIYEDIEISPTFSYTYTPSDLKKTTTGTVDLTYSNDGVQKSTDSMDYTIRITRNDSFDAVWEADAAKGLAVSNSGKTVTATPPDNNPGNCIQGKINLLQSIPDAAYEAGDIVITLPLHTVTGKSGSYVDSFSIDLGDAPFSYTTDETTNTVTITNTGAVNDALSFNPSFRYSYTPSRVEDGTTGTVNAVYTLDGTEKKTETLNYTLNIELTDYFYADWEEDSSLGLVVSDGGKMLDATPADNSPDNCIKGNLHLLQFAPASPYAPGSIVMTLPLHTIIDKEEGYADTFSMDLSGTPFTYTTDETNNLVTVTNSEAISEDLDLALPFSYSYKPTTVRDGTPGVITAAYDTDRTDAQSDELAYTIHSFPDDSFAIVWAADTSRGLVVSADGTQLDATPQANNADTHIRGRIDLFQNAPDEPYEAGDITITLPLHVIKGRDGKWADTFDIGMPMAPEEAAEVPFNYTIDEERNLVTITNCRQITEQLNLNSYFSYTYTPSTVKDGTMGTVTAEYITDRMLEPIQDSMDFAIHTVPDDFKVSKALLNTRHTLWDSDWGPAPDNVDNLVFLEYYVLITYNTGNPEAGFYGTQPATLTMTENPQQNGQVVSWRSREYVGRNNSWQAYCSGEDVAGNDAASLAEWSYVAYPDVISPAEPKEEDYYVFEVVVAYPKELVGKNAEFVNTVNLEWTPIDGGEPYTRSASNTYVWTITPYNYSEGAVLEKCGYDKNPTGKLALECEYPNDPKYNKSGVIDTGALTLLRGGMSTTLIYDCTTSIRHIGTTKDENGTPIFSEWDATVIDDQMYLENELLLPGDYEIVEVYPRPTVTYARWNEDSQVWSSLNVSGTAEEFEVLYKTTASPDWIAMSELNNRGWMEVPAGAYEVALRFKPGIAATVAHKMYVKIKLNPTEHVLRLLKDSQGRDKEKVNFVNVDAMLIHDSSGNLRYTAMPGNLGDSAIKDSIIAHDKANYGDELGDTLILAHKSVVDELDSMYFLGSLTKENTLPIYDQAKQRVQLSYTVQPQDGQLGFSLSVPLAIGESYKDGTHQTELNAYAAEVMASTGIGLDDFTYYDLLPAGFVVDRSSVKVDTAANTADNLITDLVITENFRNSGRTMIAATVDASSSYTGTITGWTGNYWGHAPMLEISAPIRLHYTGYYSFDSIVDYGTTLHNVAALMDNGDEMVDFTMGYADDPSALSSSVMDAEEKAVFTNLSEDVTEQNRNTLYVSNQVILDPLTSSVSEFAKSVKSELDTEYKAKTVALEGGNYSYKLRFSTSERQQAKELIFYDVLESNFVEGTLHWKGSFDNIDVSQLEDKGIKPVVYYSTVSGLDPYNNSTHANLGNTGIWTTVQPTDKSTITAVAVDATKTTSGNAFVLQEKQALAVIIHMTAPADASPYLRPVQYAWNMANIQATQMSNGGTWSGISINNSNGTQVSLRREVSTVDVEFKKIDGTDRRALSGVVFELRDAEGTTIATETTGTDGVISFTELEQGVVYTLVETSPLAGYTAAGPWTVTVDEEGTVSVMDAKGSGINCLENQWIIENMPGRELPATGGIGTYVFTLSGALLVIASAAGLILERRKAHRQ